MLLLRSLLKMRCLVKQLPYRQPRFFYLQIEEQIRMPKEPLLNSSVPADALIQVAEIQVRLHRLEAEQIRDFLLAYSEQLSDKYRAQVCLQAIFLQVVQQSVFYRNRNWRKNDLELETKISINLQQNIKLLLNHLHYLKSDVIRGLNKYQALILIDKLQYFEVQRDELAADCLQLVEEIFKNAKEGDNFDIQFYTQKLESLMQNRNTILQIQRSKSFVKEIINFNNDKLIFTKQAENDLEFLFKVYAINQTLSNNSTSSNLVVQVVLEHYQNADQNFEHDKALLVLQRLPIEDIQPQMIEILLQCLNYDKIDDNELIKLLKIAYFNSYQDAKIFELESLLVKRITDSNNQGDILTQALCYFISIEQFRPIEDLQIENFLQIFLNKISSSTDHEIDFYETNKTLNFLIDYNRLVKTEYLQQVLIYIENNFLQDQNSEEQQSLVAPAEDQFLIQPVLSLFEILAYVDQNRKHEQIIINTIKTNLGFWEEMTIEQIHRCAINQPSDAAFKSFYKISSRMKKQSEGSEKNRPLREWFLETMEKYLRESVKIRISQETIYAQVHDVFYILSTSQIVQEYAPETFLKQFQQNLEKIAITGLKLISVYDWGRFMRQASQNRFMFNLLLPKLAQSLDKFHKVKFNQKDMRQVVAIAQMFTLYRKELRHAAQYQTNQEIQRCFAMVFHVLEDTAFRHCLQDYEEWRSKLSINIMDPEAYKKDISNAQDKQINLIQDLTPQFIEQLFQLYDCTCELNIASKKLATIYLKILNFYFDTLSLQSLSQSALLLSTQDLGDKEFQDNLLQRVQNEIQQVTPLQSLMLLHYFAVRYIGERSLLKKLASKVDSQAILQLKNETYFATTLFIREILKEEVDVVLEIEQRLEESMWKLLRSQQVCYQNKGPLSNFMKKSLEKYAFEYKKDVWVGPFYFHFGFLNNTNVALLIDRSCYKGRSKDELGVLAVMRRYLKIKGMKVRTFDFNEWVKQERQHQKHTYIKTRLKKIPQDKEAIRRKFYFRFGEDVKL